MSELIEKNGKYYQELEVVMLPTEKCEDAFYLQNGKLKYHKGYLTQEYLKDSLNAKSFHVYFLSNEEIKENDWYFLIPESKIKQFKLINYSLRNNSREWKKIVAATDNNLIIDVNEGDDLEPISLSLPNIPIDFIQSFTDSYNKGNVITNVLVEVNTKSVLSTGYEALGFVKDFKSYKIKNGAIIIEKLEEKTYTESQVIALCKKSYSRGHYNGSFKEEEPVISDKWIKENIK